MHALETVYNASKDKVKEQDYKPTAGDMSLEEALAAIQESNSEEEQE
jgi:hypothetical protein